MRLLLALDIHHRADEVVADAIDWATRLGATLDLGFVDEYQYNIQLVSDPSVRTLLDDQWTKIRRDNRARLEGLVEALPDEVRGQAQYLAGRATEQLAAAAADYDALLVATHGRKGMAHFFLGSVAERLVRRAQVPVVVLRLPV